MAFRSDFDYMKSKREKLRHQAEFDVKDSDCTQIFKGLVLYVNGYIGTITFTDFKQMVFEHGGSVLEHYHGGITHVIAIQVVLVLSRCATQKLTILLDLL
jgi:hypothetical protein